MIGQPIGGNTNSYGDLDGNYNAIGEGAKVLVKNINQAFSRIDELEREAQIAERILAERIKAVASSHQMAIHEARHGTRSANPYKALLNYRLRDAPYFFGREDVTNSLFNRIKEHPLTILHSASGSGKTSLIKAGLSSKLLQEGHLPLYLRPFKQQPQISIKKAFLPDFDRLQELDRFKEMSLKGFLERVVTYLGDQQLYIFIDQFEEFFTMQSKKDRIYFAMELNECVNSTLPVHWVLALRKEYFSDLQVFKSLNPFGNEYYLDTFNLEEAEEVILKPALMHHVTYADGLIDHIISDLKQEGRVSPSHIQLVCHTLFDELTAEQKGSEIKKSLYLKKRGQPGKEGQPGSKGILASHLTRVLNRELSRDERKVASRLFEEMVSSETQRVVVEEDVLKSKLDDFNSGTVQVVLEKLEMSRLIRRELDDNQYPVYELAHDYLLAEIQLDPRTLQRKAAQELMTSEVRAYIQHNTLLSEEKYNIITSQRENLKINSIGAELLEKSRQEIEHQENEEIRRIQFLAEEQRKRAEEAEARQEAEKRRAEAETNRAKEGAVANQKLQRLALILIGVAVLAVSLAFGSFLSRTRALRAEAVAETAQADAEDAREEAVAKANEAEDAKAEAEDAKEVAVANASVARAAEADAEKEKNRVLTQALLAESEEFLPEGINASKTEFDSAMLIAIAAYQKNAGFPTNPPLSLATIHEQFRELITYYAEHPVWEKGKWQDRELGASSKIVWSEDKQWAVSTKVQPIFHIWNQDESKSVKSIDFEYDDKNSFVESITISSDGSAFAALNSSGEVHVWEIRDSINQILVDPIPITPFISDEIKEVISPPILFSPKRKFLVTGGKDGNIYYWSTQDYNREPQPLYKDNTGDGITSLAFSPDGMFLASGSQSSLYIWDFRRAQVNPSSTISAKGIDKSETVSAVKFSPSGNTLAAAGLNGKIRLWNSSDAWRPKKISEIFLGDTGGFASSIEFSSDGSLIASGQANGSIYVWAAQDSSNLKILDGDNLTDQGSFTFVDDSQELLSINSGDYFSRRWDLGQPNYKQIKKRGDDFAIQSVASIKGETGLALFHTSKKTKLIDLESLDLFQLNLYGKNFSADSFASNGDTFSQYWETDEARGVSIHQLDKSALIEEMQFVKESAAEDVPLVLELDGLTNITSITQPLDDIREINKVALSPNGDMLVISYLKNPSLDLWILSSETDSIQNSKIGTFQTSEPANVDLGEILFSENGQFFAIAGTNSEETSIFLWEIDKEAIETEITFKRKLTLDSAENDWLPSIRAMAFTHDGKSLAVSDNLPRVQIWSVETGEVQEVLRTEKIEVSSLAFSRDGEDLVFGNIKGTMRVVSLKSNERGKASYILNRHRNRVNSIQFLPDNKHIFSVGSDGFIVVQPTLEALMDSACEQIDIDEFSISQIDILKEEKLEELCNL